MSDRNRTTAEMATDITIAWVNANGASQLHALATRIPDSGSSNLPEAHRRLIAEFFRSTYKAIKDCEPTE